MKKFEDLFPGFPRLIRNFYPYQAQPNLYRWLETDTTILFEWALRKDSQNIDEDFIPMIANAIAGWLKYSIIVDYFTDKERIEFEQTTLHLEENLVLRAFLEKNKLRLNPIKKINTLFEMMPDLIISEKVRKEWIQLYRTAISFKDGDLSIYHTYDIEDRISYVGKIEKIIKKICIHYILSKEVPPKAFA